MATQPTPPKVPDESQEIVDLETYSKEGKQVPKGKRYQIKIDREKYVVNTPTITGRQLLEIAGKTPIERYMASQKMKDGSVKKIGYDEIVDLTKSGIERFITLPLDQTEG